MLLEEGVCYEQCILLAKLSLGSPALVADSLPTELSGKPLLMHREWLK